MRSGARRIQPMRDFGSSLLRVEKPSRYLGGELGSVRGDPGDRLTIALCFPDLYEIGMSNNAVRILYGGLNRVEGVRCERVFAPAPDFEDLCKRSRVPLYTLESGLPLVDADILGFSLGYELAATSVLCVLETGGVPILASDRGPGDPIVIAGGPVASNPHPFADFLDAAFIGEAEEDFPRLASDLARMKAAGADRDDLLGRFAGEDAIWMPARGGRGGKRAVRAIFSGFSTSIGSTAYPIPTSKTVQSHGTVEIMRGCPNGCRFCHAGYHYRPQRCKPFSVIRAEVEALVAAGYREITLASLSSGDFRGIGEVMGALNAEWAHRSVSFQLPSLKVNSFTLPLIKEISAVRKSGLTFAVETPVSEWQRRINKDVSFEQIFSILAEAKTAGFRSAKFYFMLGLPVGAPISSEAGAIIDFFDRLFLSIDMQISVNLGTFVPKPHTPFQWSEQAGEAQALDAIHTVKAGLRRYRNLKISYHSPFASQLEGILSRGDERVGELVRRAYERGARLDAWEDRLDRRLWSEVLGSVSWDPCAAANRSRALDEPLPWDDISIRVSKKSLSREYSRSQESISTSGCDEKCTAPCGSCSNEAAIVHNSEPPVAPSPHVRLREEPKGKILFRYSKTDVGKYFQHLAVVEAIHRAFLIADLPICFSEGFNPLPRLESSQPLPLGVESRSEMGLALVSREVDPSRFIPSMNSALPEGLRVEEASYHRYRLGGKQRSLGSLAWGSLFEIAPNGAPGESRFHAALQDAIRDLSPDEARYAIDDEGRIELTVRDSSIKEKNAFALLRKAAAGHDLLNLVSVTRMLAYATLGEGPISFFEAFEKLATRE